ncbi:MAG: polysaccharide deacetylase family protein [Clostridia bacterium]|nr:polysaccharide deacetylase family protein [Clostridia bacterium]
MKLRKINFLLISLLAAAQLIGLEVHGQEASFSWYCPHVKDHAQPVTGAELRFAEDCGAYYIDRSHVSQKDAEKVIYLTFDAGYENGNIEKTLDVLKAEEVTGAFFILGHLISSAPETVRRMAEEGHTVCNHTVHHKDMSGASDGELLAELSELETQYKTLTGAEMSRYYRPPEGRFSKKNLEAVQKNGYKTIFWSFAYPDWDNQHQMSCERAKRIILENLHNGEVMLLHPTSQTNAEILQDVIREAKSQGYRFGTLDELTGSSHETVQ